MRDTLKMELSLLETDVRSQFLADPNWENLRDGLCHRIRRRGIGTCTTEYPAGWTEAEDEGRGGVAVDIFYSTRDDALVAVEVETSYMSASHDFLKLAHLGGTAAVRRVGLEGYLGVVVTHNNSHKKGPQKSVYPRLVKRVEAVRLSPILGTAFRRLNLALIGVGPDGAIGGILFEA